MSFIIQKIKDASCKGFLADKYKFYIYFSSESETVKRWKPSFWLMFDIYGQISQEISFDDSDVPCAADSDFFSRCNLNVH